MHFFANNFPILNYAQISEFFQTQIEFFNEIRSKERITLETKDVVDKLNHSKKLKKINKNYYIIKTSKDGNCLWNAICNALFGNENYMVMLRLFTFFCFLKYKEYFNNICKYEQHCLDYYIRESLTLGAWGRDIHFLALSIVVKRNIFVYNIISPSFIGRRISGINSKELPIIIHFSNNNHFEAIIPRDNNINLDEPQLNLFQPISPDEPVIL